MLTCRMYRTGRGVPSDNQSQLTREYEVARNGVRGLGWLPAQPN